LQLRVTSQATMRRVSGSMDFWDEVVNALLVLIHIITAG
jgi:hypothetical protein